MKRFNLFLIITGLVGLTANALAIAGYFDGGALARWQLDRGLLLALSFLTSAYILTLWSALTWRWTQPRKPEPGDQPSRTSMFLLNALVTFPLLAFWVYLLFSTLLSEQVPSVDRWLLALGLAWVATPFAALGLVSVGEVLGPLLKARK